MSEADQRFHRFIWRYGNERSSALFVFQWKRVLFGDACSPDLAMFAIRMLADVKENAQPIGAKALKENTYIDDVANSVSEPEEAKRTITEVDSILAMGKFSIKAWNSNHAAVYKNPQENEVEFLGHVWDKLKDTLKEKPKNSRFSWRRTFEKECLGIGDETLRSLGFLLPVTMKYRMDLQAIWEAGFIWDDPLSVESIDVWQKHVEEMNKLAEVELDRCLKPSDARGFAQLHAFSDAGDRGFGT
ncbi:Hypothetical predicted protein [Paramuricea clavata]|uniref:Uncharacterized protein n=1 Tax=Paramuricea clavata TaxID=317549 RepID=A0A7D9JH54_PARCT|nr:Hypothetical predicted protein [Paramuricea clavata]